MKSMPLKMWLGITAALMAEWKIDQEEAADTMAVFFGEEVSYANQD